MWSPDSRFIVYAKASSLYYFSINNLKDPRLSPESLRKVGDGTVASTWWSDSKSLYDIDGDIVYEIDLKRALHA